MSPVDDFCFALGILTMISHITLRHKLASMPQNNDRNGVTLYSSFKESSRTYIDMRTSRPFYFQQFSGTLFGCRNVSTLPNLAGFDAEPQITVVAKSWRQGSDIKGITLHCGCAASRSAGRKNIMAWFLQAWVDHSPYWGRRHVTSLDHPQRSPPDNEIASGNYETIVLD